MNHFKKNNILYHSISLERLIEILNDGKIHGATSQRFWEDGKRRKESDSSYYDSYWMKGFSCTRDLGFAKKWNRVILILDKEKIKTNNKIIPYSWSYSYKNKGLDPRKESEEFVITGLECRTFKLKENEIYKKDLIEARNLEDKKEYEDYFKDLVRSGDNIMANKLKEPKGFIDLSKILLGVIIPCEKVNKEPILRLLKKYKKIKIIDS